VTFKTVKGAGHGFGGPEIDAMVDAFFDRHLKAATGGARGPKEGSEGESAGPKR
jgi:hypothetical protein